MPCTSRAHHLDCRLGRSLIWQNHQPHPVDRHCLPSRWFRSHQQVWYVPIQPCPAFSYPRTESTYYFYTWPDTDMSAPEPVQFGDRTITQKHLYIGLFVIGELYSLYASFDMQCDRVAETFAETQVYPFCGSLPPYRHSFG
jgi:hypothetical protein